MGVLEHVVISLKASEKWWRIVKRIVRITNQEDDHQRMELDLVAVEVPRMMRPKRGHIFLVCDRPSSSMSCRNFG